MKCEVKIGDKTRVVELTRQGDAWSVSLDGKPVQAEALEVSPNTYSILMDGRSYEICVAPRPDGNLTLLTGPLELTAEIADPRAWRGRKHGGVEAEGRQQIVAPMPGKVVRLLVAEGDKVEAGQGLFVVEAMKMQNEIRSPKSGTVESLKVKEGQPVNAGEILAFVS